jgi:hypothetical protein
LPPAWSETKRKRKRKSDSSDDALKRYLPTIESLKKSSDNLTEL